MAKLFGHLSVGLGSRAILAGAGVLLLGAAAPSKPDKFPLQLSEAGPLQAQVSAAAPQQQPQVKMQAAMYQPAPMPNPDATDPHPAAGPETPSLMPSLLSTKRVFEGDGFSYASSQAGALSHRVQPAAGLNLSVPVGQQVGHSAATGD